jgi:hypothetical protein
MKRSERGGVCRGAREAVYAEERERRCMQRSASLYGALLYACRGALLYACRGALLYGLCERGRSRSPASAFSRAERAPRAPRRSACNRRGWRQGHPRLRACVRVHACVRACVRVCVRVCVAAPELGSCVCMRVLVRARARVVCVVWRTCSLAWKTGSLGLDADDCWYPGRGGGGGGGVCEEGPSVVEGEVPTFTL